MRMELLCSRICLPNTVGIYSVMPDLPYPRHVDLIERTPRMSADEYIYWLEHIERHAAGLPNNTADCWQAIAAKDLSYDARYLALMIIRYVHGKDSDTYVQAEKRFTDNRGIVERVQSFLILSAENHILKHDSK